MMLQHLKVDKVHVEIVSILMVDKTVLGE
jgi:hypothetical protein